MQEEKALSSKKFNKGNKPGQAQQQPPEQHRYKSVNSPAKVWMVRIVVILLCVAVAVTLIPSVFF